MKIVSEALLLTAITAVTVTVSFEIVLRLFPTLIPLWYSWETPLNGLVLLHPGILRDTPIDGVPLPMSNRTYSGPPFLDLQRLGMVAAQDNSDPEKYRIELHVDGLGLPNRRILDSADIVLVGDSFAVMGSNVAPPGGLQLGLEQATGLSVYNLGVSGIGPGREAYLLERVGLPRRPRTVIWLFFSGNDTLDAATVAGYKQKGLTHYSELFPDYRRPRVYTWDISKKYLKRECARRRAARKAPSDAGESRTLPGLPLRNARDPETRAWFHPLYLRNLTRTAEEWQSDPGWEIAKTRIEEARMSVEGSGARFLLVYVPTKPEVYLPYLRMDPDLIYRMATFDGVSLELSPEEFTRAASENRGSLQALFAEFCRATGITCLVAKPYLDRVVASGEAPFFSADTHWNGVGQKALVEPLVELLEP